MKKRLSFVCMALILVFSAFTVSCGTREKNPDGSSSSNEQTNGSLPYLDQLPQNTSDYRELRALAFETNCIPDELTEGATEVDRALFKRDGVVIERYGIDIVYTPVTARFAVDTMRTSVRTGDNTYNVFLYQAQELMSVAVEGCLQDLNGIGNLDLSQEWWNQSLNRNLVINQKLFCTAGQYSQWYFGAPVCMAYNKKLATDYGITGIDELVDSGRWTLAAMQEICVEQNITADTDENGVMDAKDRYSVSVFQPVLYGLFAGAGGNFSVLNNGNIEINITDDLSIQRLDGIIRVFNSATTYYGNTIQDTEAVFKDNRALFFYATLGFMADLIDVSFEYGILPTPKLNEGQKGYISCANPQSNFCLGVPYGLSAAESDFVGLILEAYNYVSSEIVKPVKYDSFMKYRVADDPSSSERLDVMFENLYFDMNLVMNFGDTRTLINQTIFNETTNRYTSAVRASQALIQSDIDKIFGVSSGE